LDGVSFSNFFLRGFVEALSPRLVLVDCLFSHPTTNKPITIGISTFIAERILPHHPDSEKHYLGDQRNLHAFELEIDDS
jgi:hypothetical protein